MNKLTATVHWQEKNQELIAKDRVFSHSHLDLAIERAGVFTFDDAGYSYNSETGVLVSIIGYVANIGEIGARLGCEREDDVEVVERLYSTIAERRMASVLEQLDGVFFVLVHDEKCGKTYLAQSEFGCPLPVYYANTPEKLVVSTSLKALLQTAGISRSFQPSAVRDFMSYSEIVSDENTLVEGVKKLVTQRNVVVDIRSRSIGYETFRGRQETLSKEDAEARLIDSIGDSIRQLSEQLKAPDFALTLTGGFDSNLMLSVLNADERAAITAVTINGGGATNEIPAVRHVLQFYPPEKVKCLTHTMHSSVFSSMPDVVWALEGYMVQSGMLLRYALSKLVKDAGHNVVFLGSGADPVLNSDMGPGGNKVYEPYGDALRHGVIRELKKSVRNICKRSFIGDIHFGRKGETEEHWIRRKSLRAGNRERYNTQIDYNMKMHELMLNSFGIQGLYPFINRRTVQCAAPLRSRNSDKALYKQKVREHLGPEMSTVLKKSGSVVDTEDLFEANGHWLEKMSANGFLQRVVPADVARRVRRNPTPFQGSLLKVLYLRLFEKLILSGEYDDKFGDPHVGVPLEGVLRP